MDDNYPLPVRTLTGEQAFFGVESDKNRSDLAVLRHMLRQVRLHLALVEDKLGSDRQPLLYHLQERRQRAHRVVLYQPETLSTATDLPFVSFISRRREQLETVVLHDIAIVDQQMLAELTRNTSLLSYSSLELHSGHWYNLVLFNDERGKAHFKSSKTHNHAAYELSPHYYAWIRLHHGRIPGGIAQEQLTLQKTRYYFFGTQSQPDTYETLYI